ncbi:TetR/AcrR family transcriptional regulator [Actinomadura barringtoniae]|uniref:TetR/AcrR family transcriptional regulator n=1 Tax=Actinomadura barringtoniae TaxID=1427535 RepID=A0A939T9B9_9ACTN|nr:TetR/AcrR family transcriptional regulator [Actinomadura barringtoniae]MBO2447820.1 TetR/AcrR family transcriptional regulator [Actinomadura barringtoniae]
MQNVILASETELLLDAGLELMVAGGGRRPRVAEIVAAAGLSNDAFYRSFDGKDALVEAIVERGARTVVGYVRHRIRRTAEQGAEAQLRAGLEAVLRQAADTDLVGQTRAVLANASAHDPRAGHVIVTLVDGLAALFAQPAAEMGAGDPMRAARTTAGAAVAALQYWLFAGEVPGSVEIEHLVGFLLAGVRAPDPRRR